MVLLTYILVKIDIRENELQNIYFKIEKQAFSSYISHIFDFRYLFSHFAKLISFEYQK